MWNIENRDFIVEQKESLLSQNSLDNISKKLDLTQEDFLDFYNFLKQNNSPEKNKIFLENLVFLQENNVKIDNLYIKILYKKIFNLWIKLDEKHIKILQNNNWFYYRFLKWEKTNWWKKNLDINKILEIISLFEEQWYKIPTNLLEKDFVINSDEIKEKLFLAKKNHIKNISTFFNNTKYINFELDENFLKNFDNLTKNEKFEYFLKNWYFLYLDISWQNHIKLEKKELEDVDLQKKLQDTFFSDFNFDYFIIKDKKIDWRIAFSIFDFAFLPEENITENLSNLQKKWLLKWIKEKDFVEILISNELVHSNLEKKGFKKDNDKLDNKLGEIGNFTNNSEVHEFLSDVGSIMINPRYVELMIYNFLDYEDYKIEKWNIDFNWKPKEFPNYNYSLTFLKDILNNIFKNKNPNPLKNLNLEKKEYYKWIIESLNKDDLVEISKEFFLKSKEILQKILKNK